MFTSPKSNPFPIKYRFVRFLFILASLPFVKKISGTENLFRKGPFIIAGNHASHIDWLFVFNRFTAIMKRHAHCFATAKYFSNPFFKFYVELSQCIRMDPKTGARSLLTALEYLKHGEIVEIFPEGTRSLDGKIRKGKTGVAALALATKVPVVPVGLINTHKVLPHGAAFPRFARCEANIGKALEFSRYYKDYDEAIDQNDQDRILEIEENIVRIIMKEIARLSNQEYPY